MKIRQPVRMVLQEVTAEEMSLVLNALNEMKERFPLIRVQVTTRGSFITRDAALLDLNAIIHLLPQRVSKNRRFFTCQIDEAIVDLRPSNDVFQEITIEAK